MMSSPKWAAWQSANVRVSTMMMVVMMMTVMVGFYTWTHTGLI